MKIRITVDGRTVEATLDNSQASRDFATSLPTTLSMRDFTDAEKIADLPRRLDTTGGIGSCLVPHLTARGDTVTALHRRP